MQSMQQRAMDAAIDLVGTEGLRALTHRRVDERAGLPPGSTSNYARTRAALLQGTMKRIVEREAAGTRAATMPDSADALIEAMARLIDQTTTELRVLTAARLTLFMEAGHDPALREEVAQGRAQLEGFVTAVFARLGAADPGAGAAALMACAEGIILHRIVRHETHDARPVLRIAIQGALAR